MVIELQACIVDGSVTVWCKVGNGCDPWIHTCISIESRIKMAPPGLRKYRFGNGLGSKGDVSEGVVVVGWAAVLQFLVFCFF